MRRSSKEGDPHEHKYTAQIGRMERPSFDPASPQNRGTYSLEERCEVCAASRPLAPPFEPALETESYFIWISSDGTFQLQPATPEQVAGLFLYRSGYWRMKREKRTAFLRSLGRGHEGHAFGVRTVDAAKTKQWVDKFAKTWEDANDVRRGGLAIAQRNLGKREGKTGGAIKKRIQRLGK